MTEPAFITKTREALDDPRPGDRFHEMYSFWIVVVAVSADWGVTVLEAAGPFNLVWGEVRNAEPAYVREKRVGRREPYQEWITVAPWQERAEQHYFPTADEFRGHMRGNLLAGRGLDITGWAAQRANPSEVPSA